MEILIKKWTWTDRKAIRFKFTLGGFDYAIGLYSGFPLLNPVAWRSGERTNYLGWQLDILWFSLAKKIKVPEMA